jgi:2-dehydro-3-deoxygalactonokinase
MNRDSTKLIALDWGTSSLRCYRFADFGRVLEQRSFPLGILQILRSSLATDHAERSRAFERAFSETCGDWVDAAPRAALIASGMVGSDLGWREIPYLRVPIDCRRLGGSLGEVRSSVGKLVHIVPGLMELTTLPNVMRGEETQVVGALSASSRHFLPEEFGFEDEFLIGLPGTHSKWVFVRGTTINHFETFMTGEVYGVLCEHTILGRTMSHRKNEADYSSFDRGVHVAKEFIGENGFLSTIFSVRTLGLVGDLSPEQQPDYLSGLVIGDEIATLIRLQTKRRDVQHTRRRPILLAGESSLCARYARALAAYGCADVEFAANATERGLWSLAEQAGLFSSDSEESIKNS